MIVNHPIVDQIELTGYPRTHCKPWKPKKLYHNVCGCDQYEAVIKLHGQPLCEGCAKDEGIERT